MDELSIEKIQEIKTLIIREIDIINSKHKPYKYFGKLKCLYLVNNSLKDLITYMLYQEYLDKLFDKNNNINKK